MGKDLKVLMISSDRKLFEEGSAVSERIKEYGRLVGELHIVNMCDAREGFKDKQLSENVWVYPTNSITSIFRPIDAVRIGKRIVFEKKFVRGQSLITAQDIESGWAGMKIKKKWRIPLEVQLHTDYSSPYFTGFQNMVRKIFTKKVLRNADSIRDVKTLPIYIDKERIENSRVSFDLHTRYPWRFIMLAVGRLEPEKNFSLAIRILSLIRHQYSDIGLVIVGSGHEERKLKSLVKKLKLEGVVDFAGWQSDLASFYKTASVFIQTSLYEGYGMSLVEAGLSGLPVVTTPVGIAQELDHGQDAYIYPANKPESFAQGILDLMENNQKRESLKINLRHKLHDKLISKADYMAKIKDNWEKTAAKIR